MVTGSAVPVPASHLDAARNAEPATKSANAAMAAKLPFADSRDFEAAKRGLIHQVVAPETVLAQAIAAAKTLAALSPAAFALTKRQTRQPALKRLAADTDRDEVERIWTAPETLARIRDYVARTLRKS